MRRGDIWIVDLDPIAGHEQAGHRPVLIVSPDDFNRVSGVPLVVPITGGGNFARMQGFAVSLMGSGCDTTGIVRCDQVRALDLKARRGRFKERIPEVILDDVMGRLATLFE